MDKTTFEAILRKPVASAEVELLSALGYVCPEDACPCCGEQRMDWLEWDDDSITCLTCGVTYDLEE